MMTRNNLMWLSHLHAEPPNAPLFYGPFATDPTLYRERILEGFDSWLGVGQLLIAPQLFEGGLTRDVYFPKSSPDDNSLYFDLHAPFATHRAGSWVTIATPIEHGGLFAREGAVIPIGKNKTTVTALSGPARTHADGVDVILESEGGQVSVDDWRGVLIFPTRSPDKTGQTYRGEWIEDDGISAEPKTWVVKLSYSATQSDQVEVKVEQGNHGFTPLWKDLYVFLPLGDKRSVVGATRTIWRGRETWVVDLKFYMTVSVSGAAGLHI
jgi:alpha-glucosidase (family GH31 glycosyl hydrolase)